MKNETPKQPKRSTPRSAEDEQACIITPDTPSPLQSARLAASETDRPNGKTKGTKRLKG